MKKIDIIFNELRKFSEEIITFNEPIAESYIIDFEKKYKVLLPSDYKQFLKITNGLGLMGNDIYGLGDNNGENLESIYKREHYHVKVPQFEYLVPFSPDGGGNFYCFDTREVRNNADTCSVVFWVSNYIYTESDQPEVVNTSFVDYVQEVIIDWTLEDYDYNGNKRQ